MQRPDDDDRLLHVAPIGPELPSVLEARKRAMNERITAKAQRAPEQRSMHDPGEGPTPERLAKAGDDVEVFTPADSEHFKTIRMTDDWPPDRLRRMGDIDADHYNACCRYYSDWFKSNLSPAGAIDLSRERVDGGEYKDLLDVVLAARTRFNHAMKSFKDEDAYRAVDDIVLQHTKLTIFADRYRQYTTKRKRRDCALHDLRRGLSQLAAHYWPPRRTGMKSTMMPDARPTIQPSTEEA